MMFVNTNFLNLLGCSCLVASILVIWFKTEAFIEYFKLFKLTRLFKIKDYLDYKKSNPSMEYIDYLIVKHNCFFTKLITCPYCINFWLSLLAILLFGTFSFTNLGMVYIFSLIFYFLINKISI